jgi:hypothetical protein
VLANQVIYQGVAMSLMPSAILANGCSICNDLFQINVNSQFTAITVTQEYITNTQYWFVVTFAFPSASFVPNFEYTIRINPTHANFFTSADMAQILRGAFNADSFPNGVAPVTTNSIRLPTSMANRPSALGGGNTSNDGIDQSIILQLFS